MTLNPHESDLRELIAHALQDGVGNLAMVLAIGPLDGGLIIAGCIGLTRADLEMSDEIIAARFAAPLIAYLKQRHGLD